MITCIRFWVGFVVPYKVTMVTRTHVQEYTKVWHVFFTKMCSDSRVRLVGMRLLLVHQLFDPVLDLTNQTHPKRRDTVLRAMTSGKSAYTRVCNCGYGSVRGALPSLRNLPSSRSGSMHSNSQFLARAHPFLLDSFQYLHNL